MIYKIHTRDDEKLCFAEKTKSITLQKSGTPGDDGPATPSKLFYIFFVDIFSEIKNTPMEKSPMKKSLEFEFS